MTALDNAAIPLIYRGMSRKDAREKCRPFLERVGMSAHMHHRPNELSGGQQQRVAIARAIAGSPSIILADEPTGALDTKVGEEIMELFRNLNDEEGITIIMITHDPGIAAQCRRTVHMRDGMLSGA
jgi:putative ABC transport system ATP-binding protein